MEDDLGRMRVLAGRMGCPPDLWSHMSPEVERGRLIEFCHSVLDGLEKSGMSFDDFVELTAKAQGVGEDNVLSFVKR